MGCRNTGATVVTMAFPDPVPANALARVARRRVFAFNERLREMSARHGALVVDFERDGAPPDRRLWHPDRLHANTDGHVRIADAFAEKLNLPGAGADWAQPLPPAGAVSRRRALAEDLRWARVHLAPWLIRRARGVSSGDGRPAKRPQLESVRPE